MSNLLILHGGRTIGPYTPEETRNYLDNGHLAATTPAWTEGLTDWSTVAAVLALLRDRPASRTAPEFTDVAQRHLLPDGVRGFSWGALLFAPIWTLGNRVWIGLLTYIPGLGILVALWLGFNGRELAWRQGGWRDLAHFQKVQRRWTQFALAIYGVLALLIVVLTLYGRGHVQTGAAGTPARPAEPGRNTEKEERLSLPLKHSDFERVFKNRTIAEVRSALGAPVYEREDKAKGTLVSVYRKITLQPGTNVPDDIAMILFMNGRAVSFQYMQEKR